MNFAIKILLLLEIIFIVQTSSMTPEEEHEVIHGVMESCRDKESGSESDMKVLEKMGVPDTKEGKCILACIFETVGIVSEDFFELLISRHHNFIVFTVQ